MRLTTSVGRLRMRNPTMLASGILCNGPLLRLAALEGGAGAVVTKSLTKDAREGYRTPIVTGVEGGLINAVGLSNPGFEEFLAEDLPIAKQGKVPVVVSVAGGGIDEFKEICVRSEEAGADAVELNLSCPHVKKHGIEIGADPTTVRELVRELHGALSIPVYVKLGLCDDLTRSAVAAQESGADAIVIINAIKSMAIDVSARKPVLSNTYGGLSGTAIHPIAVRCVHELYPQVSIPLVGCGGVKDWRTAVEFMLAGASAVQVGTAVATAGIEVFRNIERGIRLYLDANGFSDVKEIVGAAHG
jgi:dihydroorotate dehydrogenase (NAD+) catalytic subunit